MSFYPLTTTKPPLNSYPCRDETGSLRHCTNRTREFCVHCPYYYRGERLPGCLFVPSSSMMEEKPRQETTEGALRARRSWLSEMRQQHLNSNGQPLSQSCWNCAHIRTFKRGFVCGKEREPVTFSAGMMQQRKIDCPDFEWREELDVLPFLTEVQTVLATIIIPLAA